MRCGKRNFSLNAWSCSVFYICLLCSRLHRNQSKRTHRHVQTHTRVSDLTQARQSNYSQYIPVPQCAHLWLAQTRRCLMAMSSSHHEHKAADSRVRGHHIIHSHLFPIRRRVECCSVLETVMPGKTQRFSAHLESITSSQLNPGSKFNYLNWAAAYWKCTSCLTTVIVSESCII